MRIAHMVGSFSPLSETFIYNYVAGLQKRGYESHVITSKRLLEDERPYEHVSLLHLPPRWSPERLQVGISRRLGFIPSEEQISRLVRESAIDILQQLKPDIVHAQFGPMGVTVSSIAKQLNIPLVVTFHGHDISALLRIRYWQQQYRNLAQDVDAVIGVSNYVCSTLRNIGFPQTKVHHVHVGADLSKITYTNPTGRFDGSRINCIHIGRLVPKKSPMHLIKAFAIARRKLLPNLNLQLTIVGDGPLWSSVVQTIHEFQLEDSIKLLGAVAHNQVPSLLQSAHIYTQYSETAANGDQEGQPVSLVEASASGLPVVTTRHSGIPDIILDGKTGYLVDEGDIEGMADRIVQLARCPKRWTEFGRAGRQHVEANFTLEQQLDKSIELFQMLLDRKRT